MSPAEQTVRAVVNKLIVAVRNAHAFGVDLVDLSQKLADGDLSDIEIAALRRDVARACDRNDAVNAGIEHRRMADNAAAAATAAVETAAEAAGEPDEHSRLVLLARAATRKADELEARAIAAEKAAAELSSSTAEA